MKLFSCTNEWNILPFVLLSAWYTRTVLGMHFAESSKENIISSAKGLLQEQPPENIPITQGISIRTEGQDSLSINAEVKEPKWHSVSQKDENFPDVRTWKEILYGRTNAHNYGYSDDEITPEIRQILKNRLPKFLPPPADPKLERIKDNFEFLMRNNEPARNYNLNFQINTHLRDLLDNFKVNAQLPTELDEQFSDVIKFLKDSTFKNDNEKHVIENIQKKIASLSEQLVKKIYTDLPPEEMNKYERGRKLTEQLIEYLVTVHGDASISNLLEDENIVKLIASEFHSFTMNRAYLVNVKQKSFKEIFLGSDLSNDLENIFKCFKKVEFQKNYNSIVEQYILLEASFLDQLQPNILTKLKSLFSNSNSGDKELASRELVEDLIHIKNLPTFEQASPEFGTKFDEAGKYYTLYFIIDYLIHYHGWLPKIKKITGFKLLQILERFLFVYPNDIRKPLMLEFEKDPVKVQKFQKKFHMKAKELNEEEMKSSIYNLVFGWSYRLDTYKEKS